MMMNEKTKDEGIPLPSGHEDSFVFSAFFFHLHRRRYYKFLISNFRANHLIPGPALYTAVPRVDRASSPRKVQSFRASRIGGFFVEGDEYQRQFPPSKNAVGPAGSPPRAWEWRGYSGHTSGAEPSSGASPGSGLPKFPAPDSSLPEPGSND